MIPPEKDLATPGEMQKDNISMLPDAWLGIKHFHYSEFSSPDDPGSGLKMDIEIVQLLDKIRDVVKFPIHVTSGYRTAAHNKTVGGRANSAHLRGKAVDIYCSNPHERFLILEAIGDLPIKRWGIGSNLIHIDIDETLPQEVVWVYSC